MEIQNGASPYGSIIRKLQLKFSGQIEEDAPLFDFVRRVPKPYRYMPYRLRSLSEKLSRPDSMNMPKTMSPIIIRAASFTLLIMPLVWFYGYKDNAFRAERKATGSENLLNPNRFITV